MSNFRTKLHFIRKQLNTEDVIKGATLLYDEDRGFYSPQKDNPIYNYIYYGYLFDAGYSIRTAVSLIMDGHYGHWLDSTQTKITKIFEDLKYKFSTKSEIDGFVEEMKNIIEDIKKLQDFLVHAYNRNSSQMTYSYKISIETSPFVKFLNDTIQEAQNMFCLESEDYVYIERLTTAYQTIESDFSEMFKTRNVFDQAVWDLIDNHESNFLTIVNNKKQIKERLNEIRYNSVLIDFHIYMNMDMMWGRLHWALEHRYTSLVVDGDRDGLKKFFEFCNKIQDKEYTNAIYECEHYSYPYVIQILDDDKKSKLIQGLLDLTNQQAIDDRSQIEKLAEYFKESNLTKALKKIYKRRNCGDLDKNHRPRPIMSFQYKDIEKYKQNSDFIKLDSDQMLHLMRNLGLLRDEIEPCETTYYRSDFQVFTLACVPNLIFKIFSPAQIEKNKDKKFRTRCKNQIFGREVVKYYGFDKLIVPKFGFVRFDNLDVIYEEMADIIPSQYVQEEYYIKYASRMHKVIEQLTKFCCLTGLDDIVWRNCPLDNTSLVNSNVPNVSNIPNESDVRIVLVDLGEMKRYCNSIFGGGNGRLGLIKCVDSSLFDIIKNTFNDMVIDPEYYESSFQSKIESRLNELEFDRNLEDYFRSKNVTEENRYQHITLDSDKLKFDEYDENDQKVLKDLCKDLVTSINNYFDHLKNGTLEYAVHKHKNNPHFEQSKNRNPISLNTQLKREREIDVDDELECYKYLRQCKDHEYEIESFCQNHPVTRNHKMQKKSEKSTYNIVEKNNHVDGEYTIYIALRELERIGTIFKMKNYSRLQVWA